MLGFTLPFFNNGTPEEVPQPEPGNLESIVNHGYARGSQCPYDFKPEDATQLAENVADIYCGERLNSYSDTERCLYQSSWLFGYFTNHK